MMVSATSTVPRAPSPLSSRLRRRSNLWEIAASSLKDKDKACIDLTSPAKLDDLLRVVEEKKAECTKKQWRIPRGHGKETVVLRDIFAKIATWIQKFVQIGDTIMQYDPGHAALPWAAVRFLLQVSMNEAQSYAVVLEGVEKISNLLVRYEIHERLYLGANREATKHLEGLLIGLYVLVLSFLAKAKRFYTKSSAKRAVESVGAPYNNFQELLGKISQQQVQVDNYSSLVAAEQQQSIEANLEMLSNSGGANHRQLAKVLDDLQRPINRMDDYLKSLQDQLQAAERLQILEWLSTLPYKKYHNQAQKNILQGTGAWFLENKQLLEWRVSSFSSILWLHGIPGSGKTKLTSMLIQQLLDDFRKGQNPNPVYFYCARSSAEPKRADPESILLNIAKQMSCLEPGEPILGPVRERYKQRDASGLLGLEECTDIIINLTKDRPLTTIVLDALDECDEEKRPDLLEALTEILQRSTNLVKIFVSSRNDHDIVCQLTEYPNLEIQADKNHEDIVKFVHSEIERSMRIRKATFGTISTTLKQRVIKVLCDGAQGMFRWVELQLQYLCTIKLPSLIEKRLGKLPRKLSELYDELYCTKFDSHENEETAIAEGVFRWLLCSHVPLETDEFLVAVSFCSGEAIELTKDTLLNLCFNFVVHDDSVNVFRFAHLSVREYLESKDNYEASLNHATAAFSCLSYLTLPPKRNQGPLREFNYAYLAWAIHSASSGKRRLEGGLHELFRKFLGSIQCPSPFFVKWSSKIGSILHGPVWIQLPGSRISSMRSSPVSPIFAASAWGFSEILEIEVGFEPIILDRRNKDGSTALMISSRYGQQDIVRLLLQNNVNLEIRSRYARGDGGTALQFAIRSGHTTVVRMLLDHGAIIDTQGFDKETPLLEASYYGYKDIVQILLEKGADVNLQYGPKGKSPHTALAAACAPGNADIVRLLINSGADVNSFDRRYGTALIGAATYGRCITIQLLCEAGANVNLNIPSLKLDDDSSNEYPSALIAAAARGHIDSVQLLLKSGADVDSWSGIWNYSTALISAARHGHKEITILLLEYGADVDLHNVDWKYTSALIAAIRKGHTEIVSLVLEAGADVNRKSARFGSALEAAVETDHKAAVPLLLKKGAKMDNLDLNDREKITAVIELGNIELVRAIIDWGVDVHAKDSHGWTPYDVAWAHGHKSICDLLPIEPSLNAYQDQVHGLRPDGLSEMGKTLGAWIPHDDLTVARGCTDVEIDWPHCDSVLGNHPMPAGTYSYYFEVEFINDYDRHGCKFAIGFCRAWGCPEPFWEYNSVNGRKYAPSSGDVYGPPYTAGDIVGCGVDFSANTAYFTKNGEHLGTAFTGITGRLFPVVKVGNSGTRIKVNFGQQEFVYKGL